MFTPRGSSLQAFRATREASKLFRWITSLSFSLLLVLALLYANMHDRPTPIKRQVNLPAKFTTLISAGPRLATRSHKQSCRDVHFASDQCAFMRDHCKDDEAGIVPYMALYFCSFAKLKPLGFLVLITWLATLFAAIGISASDFLCINLATIANMLGMSETLAGVTLLAFGNGSPDVFSTWTAFSTHNGSLAVGELIGAAGFITTVIAGSMAIVQPFRVSSKSFIRDAAFFTVAAAFSLVFLADGHLTLWESATMVAFYLVYVATVLLWHSMAHTRKQRRAQQVLAREHFNSDYLSPRNQNGRRSSVSDLDLAEILAPRSQDVSPIQEHDKHTNDFNKDSDDEEDRRRFFTEMSQEIRRTHRRTLSRMTSSGRSIRPSLLGAMEFGSVLSSLKRNGNGSELRLPARRHSHHNLDYSNSLLNPVSVEQSLSTRGRSHTDTDPGNRTYLNAGARQLNDNTRIRSTSANANVGDLLQADIHSVQGTGPYPSSGNQRLNLSVPPSNSVVTSAQSDGDRSPVPTIMLNDSIVFPASPSLQPEISATQPFPPYTDEPLHVSSSTEETPTPVYEGISQYQQMAPKLSSWSKLRLCVPSLIELRQTLFPTLEGWQSQGVFAKFISIATAPTVLALVLTVPVVNANIRQADIDRSRFAEDEILHVDASKRLQARHTTSYGTVSQSPIPEIHSGRQVSILSTREDDDEPPRWPNPEMLPESAVNELAIPDPSAESELSWKPWLTLVQIFTSPLFFLLAFFADDSSNYNELATWVLYVSIGSLIFSAFFLVIVTLDAPPKWRSIMAFPGFCVSIAWVSLIAGEVVGVLKTIGVITQISDAILGLTVFAVGNSLSDLLANLAIAKLGYPVMALSACFGGPMLNILLGIGLGGLSLTIKKGHKHASDGRPPLDTRFGIQVGRSLIVSGAGLLFTLVALLVAVPLNGWRMDRKIGLTLISIWCFLTIVNIVLEVTQ